MSINRIAALLAFSILSPHVRATVTYVGVESGAPTDFQAQRWSLDTEPKAHAVANNMFGSSGYYCLAPGQDLPSKPVVGGDITAFGTALRKPDFLSAHPVVGTGAWVNYSNYSFVTRPDPASAGDAWRVGGISDVLDRDADGPGGQTKFADVLSFTLTADTQFRLGIMVDAFGSGDYAPDYISVYESTSQETVWNSQPLTREGLPDLALFDIDGKAGTSYVVALHRKAPADGARAGFSLITFDRLSGADAALVAARRKYLRVGRFESPGEYMKDFFVLKEGDTFHLFYNVGQAGETQNWTDPGNEEAFGHATSKDLKTWAIHPRVIPIQGTGWEAKTVSAPSILKVNGVFKMVYTGFQGGTGATMFQRIGLAESADLFAWNRYPGNPVYVGPAWTNWTETTPASCRDAHITEAGGQYFMFTCVNPKGGGGAIASAKSPDLVHWTDLGPAMTSPTEPESPTVFEHNGWHYLIVGAGVNACYRTRDMEANQWERIPFEYPPQGFWSGFEVFKDGDRLVAAAFEWKMNGNSIDFWALQFDADKPYAVYSEADADDIVLTGSAVLNLNFSGTDTIRSLYINGSKQAGGTWGAVGSAAQHQSPLITGTGFLDVSNGAKFSDWATESGIPGELPGRDFDHDGLANLIEYALGLSPTASTASPGSFDGSTISFSKGSAAAANGDVAYAIQTSITLAAGDWTTVTPTVNSPTLISYTLPTGLPRVFARLLINQIK